MNQAHNMEFQSEFSINQCKLTWSSSKANQDLSEVYFPCKPFPLNLEKEDVLESRSQHSALGQHSEFFHASFHSNLPSGFLYKSVQQFECAGGLATKNYFIKLLHLHVTVTSSLKMKTNALETVILLWLKWPAASWLLYKGWFSNFSLWASYLMLLQLSFTNRWVFTTLQSPLFCLHFIQRQGHH